METASQRRVGNVSVLVLAGDMTHDSSEVVDADLAARPDWFLG